MATIPEGVTLGIAITGAVLGIMNTWRTFDRDRIRLNVTPKYWQSASGINGGLCIEVVNMSYLPITLVEVSFTIKGEKDLRVTSANGFMNGVVLPHRLEPRANITFIFSPGTFDNESSAFIHKALVRTACGRRFTGNSPALQSFVKIIGGH